MSDSLFNLTYTGAAYCQDISKVIDKFIDNLF